MFSVLFKVLQAFCQPRCLQLWSAVYLAYPTPYSETLMENGDTSDYGDSVSSACITPVSVVFPSANSSIDQDEEVTQTCHVTESKSDGNLVCKNCLKNQQGLDDSSNKQFNSLDRNLKSRSCPECRTAFSENGDIPGSSSTAKDSVGDTAVPESRSLYLSAQTDSCEASVVSCEDSISEIESSMSSSTATVILDTSEGDTNIENGRSSSSEKISTEDSIKETQETTPSDEEQNSHEEKGSGESCNGESLTVDGSTFSKGIPCDEEGTECIESSQEPLTKSSSSTTLTSSTHGTSPSTSTLRPSSSELFTRYLDVDGLTYVCDPVQVRLRQIEMAHQAKVESLQRQLLDVQRRRGVSTDGGTAGRTSDLADEVVRKLTEIFDEKSCNCYSLLY